MGNWASSSDKKGGGNQVLDSDLDLRDESVDEGMKEVGKKLFLNKLPSITMVFLMESMIYQ